MAFASAERPNDSLGIVRELNYRKLDLGARDVEPTHDCIGERERALPITVCPKFERARISLQPMAWRASDNG